MGSFKFYGAPGWIRTTGLRLRSPLLYPAELPGHTTDDYTLLLANISEVGVVKSSGVFEAVAECTVNKDVK